MTDHTLTSDDIKHVLRYDPDRGVFTWLVDVGSRRAGDLAGSVNKQGYVVIRINRRGYKAHRLAWVYMHGVWPDGLIDHRNGRKNDNRIANLRTVTCSGNVQNQHRASIRSRSGLLGVTQAPNGRWRSSICVHGQRTFLGYFDTAEEASAAYWKAKREVHPAWHSAA